MYNIKELIEINNNLRILVVDDQEEYREALRILLSDKPYIVDTVESAESAINKLNKVNYDLVITDLKMKNIDGMALLKNIKINKIESEVIIITGHGSINNAVLAMKEGAFSYFIKSNDPEELLKEIEKVEQLKKLGSYQNSEKLSFNNQHLLETYNNKYKNVIRLAQKASKSNANVLILGETGVGKEVIAKHIHELSDRKNYSFIDVSCNSFSETLLESELFGHEKGSFTGANERRIGRFEAANKGVLFLDEIGDISTSAQLKILKSIENKTIERIGNNKPVEIDFRLICATNKDLFKEISRGTFREDLFYRISTIVINIPPLRERREDVDLLTEFFIKRYSDENKKTIKGMDNEIKIFLKHYNFPGNIRELKNIIERLVVLSDDQILRYSDLYIHGSDYNETNNLDDDEIIYLSEIKKEAEAIYIRKVLNKCNNNVSESAKKLGLSRRQLYNKISEYNLKM